MNWLCNLSSSCFITIRDFNSSSSTGIIFIRLEAFCHTVRVTTWVTTVEAKGFEVFFQFPCIYTFLPNYFQSQSFLFFHSCFCCCDQNVSVSVLQSYILVCGFVSLTHLKAYTKFVDVPKEIKCPNLVPHSLRSSLLSLPDNGNSFSEESLALWAWLENHRVGLQSSQ